MKKLLFLAIGVAFTLSSALTVSAQSAFEGTIKFDITYDELPEEVAGMESMLPSETIISIKGEMTRVEQSVMGGTQVVIANNKTKNSTILMDMMGQKISMEVTKEDVEKAEAEAGEPKIEYVSGTKEIAGYKCKKALVTSPDTDDEFVIYYTEKIPATSSNQYKSLKGFPLSYEVANSGMKMTITAKDVKKEKVSSSLFEIPDGYTKMSQEDLKGMFGG